MRLLSGRIQPCRSRLRFVRVGTGCGPIRQPVASEPQMTGLKPEVKRRERAANWVGDIGERLAAEPVSRYVSDAI